MSAIIQNKNKSWKVNKFFAKYFWLKQSSNFFWILHCFTINELLLLKAHTNIAYLGVNKFNLNLIFFFSKNKFVVNLNHVFYSLWRVFTLLKFFSVDEAILLFLIKKTYMSMVKGILWKKFRVWNIFVSRWIPGLITNWVTVWVNILKYMASVSLSKKKRNRKGYWFKIYKKKIQKLERKYIELKKLTFLPDMVFCFNSSWQTSCLNELDVFQITNIAIFEPHKIPNSEYTIILNFKSSYSMYVIFWLLWFFLIKKDTIEKTLFLNSMKKL